MNLHDIQHLFAYTEWANSLVLDAADNLSDEQLRHDFRISHGSIFGTLRHNAAAEWVWSERWRGQSPARADWLVWHKEHDTDLAALRDYWQKIAEARRDFIAGLDEARLAADWSFKLTDGSPNTLPLGAQMQHVVNHATLHRGQIVGMMRQLGIAPPATDLLFYLREQMR